MFVLFITTLLSRDLNAQMSIDNPPPLPRDVENMLVPETAELPSTVQDHVRFFYQPGGREYTYQSIKDAHYIQGIYNSSWSLFDHVLRLHFKSAAIMELGKSHGRQPTAAGLSMVVNPARTGLWSYETGRLDVDLFDYLKSLSFVLNSDGITWVGHSGFLVAEPHRTLTINDVTVSLIHADLIKMAKTDQLDPEMLLGVTRQQFDALIVHRTGVPMSTDYGTAVNVWPGLPISWRKITEGSIDELFRFFSDIDEKTISIARVREFYTNPHGLMREKARGAAGLTESAFLCPYARLAEL